jgi:hypothetical protein
MRNTLVVTILLSVAGLYWLGASLLCASAQDQQKVRAKSAAAAKVESPDSARAIDDIERAEEARRRLNERVDVVFDDMTFQAFLDWVNSEHMFNTVVHATFDAEPPRINLRLHGVKLKTVIGHVLQRIDLDFYVEDGVLVIGPVPEVEAKCFVRAYSVADLVAIPTDGGIITIEHSLIEAIRNSIGRGRWDTDGGEGTIEYIESSLAFAIRAPWRVHEELDEFFGQLRLARQRTESQVKEAGLPDARGIFAKIYAQRRSGRAAPTRAQDVLPNLDSIPTEPTSRSDAPPAAIDEDARRIARRTLDTVLRLEQELVKLRQSIGTVDGARQKSP